MFIATSTLILVITLAYLLGVVTVPTLLFLILTSRGRIVAERVKNYNKQ